MEEETRNGMSQLKKYVALKENSIYSLYSSYMSELAGRVVRNPKGVRQFCFRVQQNPFHLN